MHHEMKHPVALDYLYATPVDMVLNGGIGEGLGFSCVCWIWKDSPRSAVLLVYGTLRLLYEMYIHTGMGSDWIPVLPFRILAGAESHAFHHSHTRGNYASTFPWWDAMMGTEIKGSSNHKKNKNKTI